LFADFDAHFPDRFVNVTNGVTPRRWLRAANPGLSALIDARLGRGWENELERLGELLPLAEDAAFLERFRAVKRENKQRLAREIQHQLGITLDPDAMFDVQIKRIHEYKRQLLNVLHVITRYHRMRQDPGADWTPRVVIFSGKAAPGYAMAKRIIQLINNVAAVINADPEVGDRLKVVFLPNYSVSLAELIIPAADLSEQISTAGMEASGTGNMKLAMNGALTIGTLDGANIEIRDAVGSDNIFIFGLTAEEVAERRAHGYYPIELVRSNAELAEILRQLRDGQFSPGERRRFASLVDSLTADGEHFFCLADYQDYVDVQERLDTLYQAPDEWARRAVRNAFGMSRFSSDRAIREYAERIWHAGPIGAV
jgi:starch phosphorylase